MMDYRHCAYSITTGQIINCGSGNQLKRAVALTSKVDKELYGTSNQWRFSHDFGKKWEKKGLPVK